MVVCDDKLGEMCSLLERGEKKSAMVMGHKSFKDKDLELRFQSSSGKLSKVVACRPNLANRVWLDLGQYPKLRYIEDPDYAKVRERQRLQAAV